MADLTTQYMNIELKNPVIVGSSGLTGSVDGIKRCADAGAGAVVLKSMFEELIISQSDDLEHEMIQSEHPEAYDYIRAELAMQIGPRPYLRFIGDVKRNTTIPVIASVNCISAKWWVPYAKHIESAGADGIELNISHFPGVEESSSDIEKRYAEIVSEVTGHVSIPVSVKLGFYFTSLACVLESIVDAGAQALVLFNRIYSVDVDVKEKAVVPSMNLSSPQEMLVPLRWIGVISDSISCDIAASTGIHDSESIIKMLMVGAQTVQVCSVLYRKGPEYISELVNGVGVWLDENGYSSTDDIRGTAVKHTEKENILFKRLQYVKALEEAAKYEF